MTAQWLSGHNRPVPPSTGGAFLEPSMDLTGKLRRHAGGPYFLTQGGVGEGWTSLWGVGITPGMSWQDNT